MGSAAIGSIQSVSETVVTNHRETHWGIIIPREGSLNWLYNVLETLCIDPMLQNHRPIQYWATVEDVTDEGKFVSVHTVTAETTGTAQPDIISDLDRLIFTRATDAFKPNVYRRFGADHYW